MPGSQSHSAYEASPLHKVSCSKPEEFLFFPLLVPLVYHWISNKKIWRAKYTMKWSATSIGFGVFFFHITHSSLFSSVVFFSITQETLLLKAQITITKLFQYFHVFDAMKQQRNKRSMQTSSIWIYHSLKHACYIILFTKASPFYFPPPSLVIVWLHYNMLILILF